MTAQHDKQSIHNTWQKIKKSPKLILAAIISFIIVVIFIYSVVVLVIRHGKVAVSVTVAPYAADLTLNGVKIRNNKTIYLEKGHYHLVVENEHFYSKEADIVISENQHYIAALLEPSDEEGQKYLETHERQFTNAQGALALSLNAEGKDFQEKYPIAKYLPINNRFYSISYQKDENGVPIVNIKTTPSYLDVAIAKLKTLKGVSIPDYEINFTFANPFLVLEESSSDVESLAKKAVSAEGYSLESGQYITDEYYLAIYTQKDPASLLPCAKYLGLFRKDEENWKLISKPHPILTHINTPDTPTDILNSANSYAGQ